MTSDVLMVVSYVMGLVLSFQIGVQFGQAMQRKAVAVLLEKGCNGLNSVISNIKKRGVKDEQRQADNVGGVSCDDIDRDTLFYGWPKGEKSYFHPIGRTEKGRISGRGGDESENPARDGKQSRQGIGGETQSQESE